MGEPILSVKGITKRFGGLVALKNVSFDVYPGEVVGLMGPNGAGKTTLLNIIAGEYTPDTGDDSSLRGQDITHCPPHQVCHLGIARTYQIPQPFVTLSVRENLLVSAVFGRQLKGTTAELEDDRIFDLVNLSEKKETLAGNLPILSLKKLELRQGISTKPGVAIA